MKSPQRRPNYRAFAGVKNFGEDDFVDSVLIRLETMEAVEALIAGWVLDRAAFDAPWKVDYPL